MKVASWICKVVAGMGFGAYAIFSAAIGAIYLTPSRGGAFTMTPIWSRDRSWVLFDGPAGVVLILALVLLAASLFVRPAAGTAHWEGGRAGTREALGKMLLQTSGVAFVLGLLLSFGWSARDPVPATVEGIRALVRAERSRDQLFRAVQPVWGVVLVVSLIAMLVDMVLRHRSEHAGWRPRIPPRR